MSEKLHYSLVEWKAYRDNLVNDDKREKMQNHLLECEECMEIYLSLMKDFEEETSRSIVPERFTEQVMGIINEEKRKVLLLRRKSAKTRFMTYYVSAASVTLFLVASGVFTSMFNGFSKIDTQLNTAYSVTGNIFTSGWTDQLVDRTSKILDISQNK